MFTKKDEELMLTRFADMLDLLTFDIVKGRGDGTGTEGEEGHR